MREVISVPVPGLDLGREYGHHQSPAIRAGARHGGSRNAADPDAVGRAAAGSRRLARHAVGKDFPPGGGLLAAAPGGTGFQVSLYGLVGIMLAAREGLEVNLLGLSFGIDPVRPALKLPALGRLGLAQHRAAFTQ